MRAPILFIVALAFAAPTRAAPARARKPRVAASVPQGPLTQNQLSTGQGRVTSATADGIYLDRGGADGLKVGDKVQSARAGRAPQGCTVTLVSEHSAVCKGQGFVVGDRITLERAPVAPLAPIGPVPDIEELTSRRRVVQGVELPLTDFEGQQRFVSGSGARLVEVRLSHITSTNMASAGGPYQMERADAAVRDLKLWRGLHASLDVSVVNFARRPDGFRSPLTWSPQLFVRQAELSWHEPGGLVRASLGRTWTRATPGLSVLDGAQVGLSTKSGDFEGGAFGGLLPDPYALRISTSTWAAGAYAFARFTKGTGADAMWFQPEARVGWAVRNGLGGRLEAAAALHGWVGRSFDVHLAAQAGIGAATALDFARLDIGARPTERMRLWVGARYRGNTEGEVLEVGALNTGTRALHTDGQLLFDVASSISIALSAGFAADIDSRLMLGRVGPQLQFPRLFGSWGGVSLGYQEEIGWVRGRSGFLQASLNPHWRIRFLGRAMWAMQGPAPSEGMSGHEVGGSLSAEARIMPWLWVRAAGLLRSRTDGSGSAANLSAHLGVDW